MPVYADLPRHDDVVDRVADAERIHRRVPDPVGVFARARGAVFAASGVVLGAAYMLYLYQRTMFGKIENPKNEGLFDLSHREFATFAPPRAGRVDGLYPSPFLRRIETSVNHRGAREPGRVRAARRRRCADGGIGRRQQRVAVSRGPSVRSGRQAAPGPRARLCPAPALTSGGNAGGSAVASCRQASRPAISTTSCPSSVLTAGALIVLNADVLMPRSNKALAT